MSGGSGGLVPQALRHALQAELDEWFQLLAVLEAQRQSELTLLQLLVWSAEPMQRLLLMAQLTRSSAALKGGALTVAIERRTLSHLLSPPLAFSHPLPPSLARSQVAIERHERHGDPLVRGYVRHLLRAACAPLFGMVRSWVLHGELADAHDEFFIE